MEESALCRSGESEGRISRGEGGMGGEGRCSEGSDELKVAFDSQQEDLLPHHCLLCVICFHLTMQSAGKELPHCFK